MVNAPVASSGEGQSKHSSEGSDRSKNLTGNPLYSAATRNQFNPAYADPAKLVSMTRAMLNKAAAFPEETRDSDLELHSITPGQIADLCRLQQLVKSSGENQAYKPLNPYTVTTSSTPKEAEQARLDVRLRSLREKLAQYGGDEMEK
jgi:hypothetical protein